METTSLDTSLLTQQLALLSIPGIGCTTIKKIVDTGISPTSLLTLPKKALTDIGILSKNQIQAILNHSKNVPDNENVIKTLQKFKLQPIFITDPLYPKRLLDCNDPPIMLFSRGTHALNQQKVISIIGTRHHTPYGNKVVEHIIQELASVPNLAVISGLAAGIDSIAHKESLKNNIPTIGVLGHGHDIIYPATNRGLAKEMIINGSIISEYLPYSIPDKSNFPMRNRIVAGMSDMVVVVESKEKGGAIITAKLACSYNKTVGAVPGNIFDASSAGCNSLLSVQIAIPITSAADILAAMNWDVKKIKSKQVSLFTEFSKEEQLILKVLSAQNNMHIDELMLQTKMGYSQIANLLLNLELQNAITSLPGKRWSI